MHLCLAPACTGACIQPALLLACLVHMHALFWAFDCLLHAQAQLDDIAVLKAEVAQLQAIKEDQVKEADSHLRRSNEWCEEMIEVMSRTTGLSLVSIEEDCVHVRLEQEVPVNVGASEGEGTKVTEKAEQHVLLVK
eukprot:1159371-Pelagomonas_calceolata.AAC.1